MEGYYTDYMVYGNFCSMDNQAFPLDCETLSAIQGNATKLAVIAHIAGCERLILTGCKLQANGIRTEGFVFINDPNNPITGEILYHPEARDHNGKCQIYEYDEDVTADGTEYPGAYTIRYLDDDVYWDGDGVMEWSSFTDIADISNATLKALLDKVNKDIADLKKIFNGGIEGNATNFATLLSNEAKAREAADQAEAKARAEAIQAEAEARDRAIAAAIDKEVGNRDKAIAAAAKTLDDAIKQERQERLEQIRNLPNISTNSSSVPRGVIVMWSGAISEIPAGWALCDGEEHIYNGNTTRTVNLSGRFVLGAETEDGEGDTFGVGFTGGSGSNRISITLTPDNLPEHRHIYTDDTHLADENNVECEYVMLPPNDRQAGDSWSADGNGSGRTFLSGSEIFTKAGVRVTSTTPTPISSTLSNLPPYYALAYIQKL